MTVTSALPGRPAVTARRGVSLLAVASLFVVVGRGTPVTTQSLRLDTVFVASALGVIAVLAVAAASVPRRRLLLVDAVTLAAGLLIQLVQFAGANDGSLVKGTDETLLNRLAMRTVLAGHDPYAVVYRSVGANGFGTPLFGGGQANRYAYPPLELEIGRAIAVVTRHFATPAAVGAISLVALAVGTFVALPSAWRPMSTIAVLGLGLFEYPAITGETVILAMALLCLPLYRWSSTGAGGRLGPLGVAQAVALGLAVSAGQLAWFVTVFLILALALVRRGELGGRGAARMVGRYAAIAVAVAAVVDLPYILADAGAWARGMASTLTQHAIVAGSGWALPLIELHGGSSRVGLLAWSAVLLLVGSWVCFGAWFRRCAPALAVFPSLGFMLSSRSDPTYLFALVPLWLVAAATVSPAAIAGALPLRLPRRARPLLAPGWLRAVATVAILAPAVVIFALAVTGPPPMSLRPTAAVITSRRLVSVTVVVENLTDHTVTPQYFIDRRTAITHPWVPLQGARALPPHRRETVVLRTRTRLEAAPLTKGLWIFSTVDSPEGMTGRPLLVPASNVTVVGLRGVDARRRACLAALLARRHDDCTT